MERLEIMVRAIRPLEGHMVAVLLHIDVLSIWHREEAVAVMRLYLDEIPLLITKSIPASMMNDDRPLNESRIEQALLKLRAFPLQRVHSLR